MEPYIDNPKEEKHKKIGHYSSTNGKWSLNKEILTISIEEYADATFVGKIKFIDNKTIEFIDKIYEYQEKLYKSR